MIYYYCLFEARHELPDNNGALCYRFNFDTKQTEKTKYWYQSIQELIKPNNIVYIYVTGLTPALTEYLSCVFSYLCDFGSYGELILLHYDKETKTYWKQKIF